MQQAVAGHRSTPVQAHGAKRVEAALPNSVAAVTAVPCPVCIGLGQCSRYRPAERCLVLAMECTLAGSPAMAVAVPGADGRASHGHGRQRVI